MSAHFQGSVPRSNAYSESKFTHWTIYDPFFAEALTVYKRFDERLPSSPSFPRIIVLAPHTEFMHPCSRKQIEHRLAKMPPEHPAKPPSDSASFCEAVLRSSSPGLSHFHAQALRALPRRP